MLFIVIYSHNGLKVRLEMDNLSEALEVVGENRILTIWKQLESK